jgi:UDP-2,3-diacylglucosamine hydrolase
MSGFKKTIFISDLHLEETRPDITRIFLHLLKNCDASVDALYILGDLFEAWVGDDNDTPLHREVISALKAVTRNGIPVYFIHGNRDFLIGRRFLNESGCILLPDEAEINLYNTPVLVMHGDTLCTRDQAYMKARRKTRNPVLQALFLLLPLSIRRNIADKMRAKSQEYTSSAPKEIMDVTQEEVRNVMLKHKAAFLIHGHTHRPGIHDFLLGHIPATRIVLGAWHEKGNMLIWNESGEKKLVEFDASI